MISFGTHREYQESEARGFSWLRDGGPFIPLPLYGITAFTTQQQPDHPGPFIRDFPPYNNNVPPPIIFPKGFPKVQENLAGAMLGITDQSAFQGTPGTTDVQGWVQPAEGPFAADTAEVVTMINYDMIQLFTVGWTPVGGLIVNRPIGVI